MGSQFILMILGIILGIIGFILGIVTRKSTGFITIIAVVIGLVAIAAAGAKQEYMALTVAGFVLIVAAVIAGIVTLILSKDARSIEYANKHKLGYKIEIVLALVFVGCLIYAIAGGGLSGASSPSTATCQVCGRSYQAGDSGGNYMSIARTHMCKNCYNNYQWAQEQLGR